MPLRLTLRLGGTEQDFVECVAEVSDIGERDAQVSSYHDLRNLGAVAEEPVSVGDENKVGDAGPHAEAPNAVGKNYRGRFKSDNSWSRFNFAFLDQFALPA